MAAYKSVALLNDINAAYVAGLIDGEGTITLSRRHRQDTRQLVVSVANTERELLEFVLRVVGAGKITGKRIVSDKHAPSFVYSVSNRQALSLLTQICCFLQSHKRKRAELILARYVELVPRNGKCTPTQKNLRVEFERQLLAITPRSAVRSEPREEGNATTQVAHRVWHQGTPPTYVGGGCWWRRRDSCSISFETGWTMPSSCANGRSGACYPRGL